ncbi:MAG: DUF4279 domain-containing protein [bacterium]|nr:DUF4279 domain-containing protein [bacterium]
MSPKASVHFTLESEDLNPDTITTELEISPSLKFKKGDWTQYNPCVKFGLWGLQTDEKEIIYIDDLVLEVYDKLAPKTTKIQGLVERYNLSAVLMVVLWIDTNQEVTTPSLVFNEKIIEFLHQTKATIGIDMYRYDSSEDE